MVMTLIMMIRSAGLRHQYGNGKLVKGSLIGVICVSNATLLNERDFCS